MEIAERLVIVKTQFVGFHRWSQAPDVGRLSGTYLGFLRDMHRHVFHVTVAVIVEHDDRAVEFFDLLAALDDFILTGHLGWEEYSCEAMAEEIGLTLRDKHQLKIRRVTVSEDGENAGEIWFK